MSDVSIAIVKNCLLGFNILGTFGNLNIIAVTFRYKEFHHKCGLLLGFLAVCDLTCLWFELQSFIRMSFGWTEETRRRCFYFNSGYVFAENLEVYVILALAIDRQLAISLPFKYRTLPTAIYLLTIVSPGFVIGLVFVIWSFATLTDDIVDPCVLPYSMPDTVFTWWNRYNMAAAIATTILYAVSYVKLYLFSPFGTDEKQASIQKTILSTLIVQVIVFFFSSVLSAGMIIGIRLVGWEDVATQADVLAVIPGLLSYSCNFYVYLWRSKDYRSAFIRHLFCGRSLVKEDSRNGVSVSGMSAGMTGRTRMTTVVV